MGFPPCDMQVQHTAGEFMFRGNTATLRFVATIPGGPMMSMLTSRHSGLRHHDPARETIKRMLERSHSDMPDTGDQD